MLHFDEKGGKSREIRVRHDLEQMIFEYIEGAGLRNSHKDTPLFRTAYRKTGHLTENALYVVDVSRMVKRRLKDAGLPMRLAPLPVLVFRGLDRQAHLPADGAGQEAANRMGLPAGSF
jgi:hypothetical protein